MAIFRYSGWDESGRKHSGRLRANTPSDVVTQMKQKGIVVTGVKQISEVLNQEVPFLEERIKLKDFVIYIRQFSTLIRAGISVVDATAVLKEQTSSKPLRKALEKIEEGLREGHAFSDLAEKHKKVFPALLINMVRAGEAGGNLDEILDRMAIYYEKQNETRQKVKSAMTYPVVIGVVAIGIVVFLLATVIPTFADMLVSMGGEVPMITKIVLAASDIVMHYWWMVLAVLIGMIFGFKALYKNKKTRYYIDYIKLRTPVFGTLIQKAAMARMTRTMSSLFASSVPILQSVSIVERIVENEVIEEVLRESRGFLERGDSMVIPMERSWVFPPLVTQMISVGEKTGSIDSMLEKVAEFYEAEVETATDQIKSLIEPAMIVFLSVVVGGIVASVMVPMFSMFDTIG